MTGGEEKNSGDNLVVLRFQSPGVLRRRRMLSLYFTQIHLIIKNKKNKNLVDNSFRRVVE